MIRLEIANVGGVQSFALDLAPGQVTRLVGANATGKSTVAACLTACLAQTPDPLRKGTRRHGAYVRRGVPAEQASAILSAGDWSVRWSPASGRFAIGGEPPTPPALAVMDPAARGRGDWIEAIEGEPVSASELADALEPLMGEGGRAAAERIADSVIDAGDGGWRIQEDLAKERRARAKGEWEAAVASVGERATYGERAAAGWTPKGWTPDHEALVEETCARRLQDATDEARAAASVLGSLEARIHDADMLRADRAAHEAGLAAARQELGAMPAEPPAAPDDGELAEAETALEARRADRTAAETAQREADEAKRGADREEEAAKSALAGMQATHLRARTTWQCEVSDAEWARRKAVARVEAAESAEPNVCPHTGEPCPATGKNDPEAVAAGLREKVVAAELVLHTAREREPAEPDYSALEARKASAASDRQTAEEALSGADRALYAARKAAHGAAQALKAVEDRQQSARKAATDHARRRARLEGRIAQMQERTFDDVVLPDESDLEEARTAIDRAEAGRRTAERDRDWVAARTRATAAHEKAVQWDGVARILSPNANGYRAKRLKAAADKLRKWLARIAPWVSIGLDSTPGLTIGGAIAADGSESERWAAHAALRIAVAAMRGSPATVLDGADVLTGTPRAELYATVATIAAKTDVAVLWTESRDGAELGVM